MYVREKQFQRTEGIMMTGNPSALEGQNLTALTKNRILEMLAIGIIYIIIFLILNYIHFRFFVVSVILYASILDAILASFIVILGIYLYKDKLKCMATEVVLILLVSNLCATIYAIMGPTVIDRSLSLYIVQKLDQRGGEIALSSMEELIILEYMDEFRLVDVRLTEQLRSGTAIIVGNCVVLTPRGELISNFVAFYRENFLPRRRYLLGEVTDQLTNPFEGHNLVVNAEC